jgi:hypothetical protein
MAFGHQNKGCAHAESRMGRRKDPARQLRLAGSEDNCLLAQAYFDDSPPKVTLIPARKLRGSAGKPGAGS